MIMDLKKNAWYRCNEMMRSAPAQRAWGCLVFGFRILVESLGFRALGLGFRWVLDLVAVGFIGFGCRAQ